MKKRILHLKFKSNPKDLTWDELRKILVYFVFNEISKKGQTGGSRVKFIDSENKIINLHRPHPSDIVKSYVAKQLLEKLSIWKII